MMKIILLEIICYWLLVSQFGFWKVTGYYWIPTALSAVMLILFGPFLIFTLRMKMMSGALMSEISQALSGSRSDFGAVKVLNAVSVVAGLVCLLIPMITSRLLGLALILPGFRHLLLWTFRKSIYAKIQAEMGKQRASMGAGHFGGFKYYYKSYNPNTVASEEDPIATGNFRDVTGTDKAVEPKLINDKNKNDQR